MPLQPPPVLTFTAQELVDAVHAAIDKENLACEHPPRTEAVIVAHPPGEFIKGRESAHFVPRQDADARAPGMVDVMIQADGRWDVWERARDHIGNWGAGGVGLADCVEACLDALCDLGVL